MSKKNFSAEFNQAILNLREVIISQKDVWVKTDEGSYTPGFTLFNDAGNFTEHYNMLGGEGRSIGIHSMIMKWDEEPISMDLIKPSDLVDCFKNGYHGNPGRDSYDIISTKKIEEAAQKVAEILKSKSKLENQELGRQCYKAKVDFWLIKTIGLEEAKELMEKLYQTPDGSGSGLYSKDNQEKAWYSRKELSESFWQFGKDRRSSLFGKRTGIAIPSSNKEMPLLEKEINRILTK